MLHCPRCEAGVRRSHSYCGECGHELGADQCQACNAAVEAGDRFCRTCGTRLPGAGQADGSTDWTPAGAAHAEQPHYRDGGPGNPIDRGPRSRQRHGGHVAGSGWPAARRGRPQRPLRRHPKSSHACRREQTPALTAEEVTRRRAMRIGGGLVSTGFTFSALDGLLRLVMDDPPTEMAEQRDTPGVDERGEDDSVSASTDPRWRFDPSGEGDGPNRNPFE